LKTQAVERKVIFCQPVSVSLNWQAAETTSLYKLQHWKAQVRCDMSEKESKQPYSGQFNAHTKVADLCCVKMGAGDLPKKFFRSNKLSRRSE